LILKSLSRGVKANAVVYIEGDALYADDIQRAIKTKLLTAMTPEGKIEVKEKIVDKTNEAVIINKTDRVVIVGNFPIRPNGSAIKDLNKLDKNALRQCVEKNLIQIIVNVDEEIYDEPEIENEFAITVEEEQVETEAGIEILEESPTKTISPEEELAQLVGESDEEEKAVADGPDGAETAEDREDGSKCVVWDFRSQETKKPRVVPQTVQKMITEEEPDVDMVDALDEVNDVEEDAEVKALNDKIENMKKQLAQKKASKKKTSKKKESKVIKTKFSKESEKDIAQALDSMGNPLSNEMTHMVDVPNGTEVSFCDQEQAQKNIEKARKQGNSINLDLD